MRVLHVINHTGRFNGNVHAAVDLACAQADMGHAAAIVSGGGDFDEILRAHGVTHELIARGRSLRAVASVLLRLYRLIRRYRPDVVHAHMVTSVLLAWPMCKVLGVPLVATVHNAFNRSAVMMGVSDRVIAVSAAVGAAMGRRGVAARKIRVVLNGTIGAARVSGALPPQPTLMRPSIVFLGGLHPRKGLAVLIEAFAAVHAEDPRCHLYIVGEGPTQPVYEAMSASLACRENVVFCGAFPDPRAYLRAADIFVLPSLADPAPLVLSEAREAGCAIVASDVDGIPEMLENGSAGLLVAAGSSEALATGLLDVRATEESLRSWRERSQIGIAKMSVTRVAAETVAVYSECVGLRRRRRHDVDTTVATGIEARPTVLDET